MRTGALNDICQWLAIHGPEKHWQIASGLGWLQKTTKYQGFILSKIEGFWVWLHTNLSFELGAFQQLYHLRQHQVHPFLQGSLLRKIPTASIPNNMSWEVSGSILALPKGLPFLGLPKGSLSPWIRCLSQDIAFILYFPHYKNTRNGQHQVCLQFSQWHDRQTCWRSLVHWAPELDNWLPGLNPCPPKPLDTSHPMSVQQKDRRTCLGDQHPVARIFRTIRTLAKMKGEDVQKHPGMLDIPVFLKVSWSLLITCGSWLTSQHVSWCIAMQARAYTLHWYVGQHVTQVKHWPSHSLVPQTIL